MGVEGEAPAEDGDDDVVPEGTLICNLTREPKTATPQEETLQKFIEELHREYEIALEDMERDVKLSCVSSEGGREKTRTGAVSLAVYEHNKPHTPENIIRVVVIAKPGTKAGDKAIGVLEEVLGNLSEEREQVFGMWTNNVEQAFRMRTYDRRTGLPQFTELADFPAPEAP